MGCDCDCGPSLSVEESTLALTTGQTTLAVFEGGDTSVALAEDVTRLTLSEEVECVLIDGEEVAQCNLFTESDSNIVLLEGSEVVLVEQGSDVSFVTTNQSVLLEHVCGEFTTSASAAVQEVFVQDTQPSVSYPALWIQTGLGPLNEDFTFKFWDPDAS